jgi:hypothetical protein
MQAILTDTDGLMDHLAVQAVVWIPTATYSDQAPQPRRTCDSLRLCKYTRNEGHQQHSCCSPHDRLKSAGKLGLRCLAPAETGSKRKWSGVR